MSKRLYKTSYICSPYKSLDPEQMMKNIRYAEELVELSIRGGIAPMATHLMYPQFLLDSVKVERERALKFCLEWISRVDKVIVGLKYGISEGMKLE